MIQKLFAKFWGYVVSALAGIIALFGLYIKIKSDGEKDAVNKIKEKEAENFRKVVSERDQINSDWDAVDAKLVSRGQGSD